jgi:uncharacterized protein YaaQ
LQHAESQLNMLTDQVMKVGNTYALMGFHENAVKIFTEAIEKAPRHIPHYAARGKSYGSFLNFLF